MKNHLIYAINENGSNKEDVIAEIHPASQHLVDLVLSKPIEGDDNRSEWVWVRLQNGDLILGTFPQGDTYFEIEEGVHKDGA